MSFSSDPLGATFSVGGQTKTTPDTLKIPKEDYQIVFSKPGYADKTFELKRQVSFYFYGSIAMGVIASSIDILTGAWKEFQTTEVKVQLDPLPDTPEELPVKITSEPPGAEILINDAIQGRTPKDLAIPWRQPEREKAVMLRLAGHFERTVALKRGEPALHAVLDPRPVKVRVHIVTKPAGADVRVEGRAVGQSPVYADVEWLPKSPPKDVELAKAGYRPEKFRLAGERQDKLEVELAELPEEIPLEVRVSPLGAQVEVDGVPVAWAPATVTLRWSVSLQRHAIRISQPGYASKTVELAREQANQPLELRLAPVLPKVP